MNELELFLASRPDGFLTQRDYAELARIDRLCPCLVRCGNVRFTCGAQDLAEMIRMVQMAGDYVRDVSVTSLVTVTLPYKRQSDR